MYWEVSVWMLITLQSYNWLIPKNCENRHFDVEAEVVPFCPMSHRWDKWDKVGQVGQSGTNGTSWYSALPYSIFPFFASENLINISQVLVY